MASWTYRQGRQIGLCAVLIPAMFMGCGGGGGDIAGIGSGGTGSYSSGAISGYGSIIVNQVHFDETTARVLDEDGKRVASAQLQLGMVVDVSGDDISVDGAGKQRSKAREVIYRSELKGEISSISGTAGNGNLAILDQNVAVDAATVFDSDIGGFAGLNVGEVVTVYGYYQKDGNYNATRIEPAAASTSAYSLRGRISSLDVTPGTFMVGNALIRYSTILPAPVGLANGSFVRVALQVLRNSAGEWVASRVVMAPGVVSAAAGSRRTELEGYVTDYVDSTHFRVDDNPIDASQVASLPTGIANGTRVEVKGVVSNGTLIASEVKREDENERASSFEIEGSVSDLDTTAKTFVIRNTRISYAASAFDNGSEAALRNGIQLEVKGSLAADGTTLNAERIKFDN